MKKTLKNNPKYFQNLYITLDDGSLGAFTGKVLVEKSDGNKKVTDIKLSKPRKLEEGLCWDNLDNKV